MVNYYPGHILLFIRKSSPAKVSRIRKDPEKLRMCRSHAADSKKYINFARFLLEDLSTSRSGITPIKKLTTLQIGRLARFNPVCRPEKSEDNSDSFREHLAHVHYEVSYTTIVDVFVVSPEIAYDNVYVWGEFPGEKSEGESLKESGLVQTRSGCEGLK
ncbi:hypothetical protein EAI_16584 [Harpegnathos saltator]|uniref:Uncharacterized protein n=1 Tax=Harpegnathos saltator TaxID=610380 RepID=E2BNV9_HARSA|nr:hypothetical protein EAI_16584 [Harpegnathos saltator]